MIRFDLVYELVDLRKLEPWMPMLAPAAMLKNVIGGLELQAANNRGFVLQIPDDNEEVVEQHADLGQVVLHTEQGRVILTPLSLDSYNRSVRPFVNGPRLRTTDEVQSFWKTAIRSAEG